MPRGAQVIYPKDLGAILLQADIGPGMRVLEAGVGSGALSMTLLRAGAIITAYEIREDFAQQAIKNVHDLLGDDVAYDIHIRDVTAGHRRSDLDRIILDMPEPWDVVKHAEGALRPGGILLAYLPTINQTQLLRETLRHHSFGLEETVEILRRTWHIDGRSVRPDHRMVAHTGFLTSARRLVARRRVLLVLVDEDALTGALFGGLNDRVFHAGRHVGEAFGTAGIALHVTPLLYVGQAVVEQREDRRADLLAESVAGAEVLVDPNLHLWPPWPLYVIVTLVGDRQIL
jgi:tRNA (adenine57-N1/adenine58-N1)-methyltransferase